MPKKFKPDSVDIKNPQSYPNLEFHLRGSLKETYQLKLPLVVMENSRFRINYRELQNLAHAFNESDESLHFTAGELYGMGLLSLISHKVIRLYRNQVNSQYISELTEFLSQELESKVLEDLLSGFLKALPSESYLSTKSSIKGYLKGVSLAVPHMNILVEELLVHLMALKNPAFKKYSVVFKEAFHAEIKTADKLLESIKKWSAASTGFGSANSNIIDILLEPMLSAPKSIQEQLSWIKSHWGSFLGSQLSDLLTGLDHFEEEQRFRGTGPGGTQVPSYSGDLLEGEYYSEDSAWMPSVVMIARNTLVWLDQLSKKYEQDISTLDDIPDQELDLLAQQGFTVLWLIGLWDRSTVSKKIKHWCGNPDAESSAYSLKEYRIDPVIGGPTALDNLKRRAWERGIRLASDMVPNHTGLDAEWLKQHPDWYVTADHAPFPSYQFDGGDLSDDTEVSIHLEDHYYDRSDAAVVFKHYDHRSGQARYVYHGNDGTSMPWNDTAQLNYLNPELRETVIQTILEVARQFKVIRFDAAMTLAKRHIQRLWFPEPGSGGDIPSRSEFSMSGADFNAAIPAEFWREVVDRVAKEVPDTLLLAEAFWMMESYFVRTLGMHRVYNSAFMNMLKMEENTKFFDMIAATLEFDPRILQRFVNFLSNPDEDTAIAQFGKGDKYFGATILMVTLPGLPMFAHAQIEGFEEKYGMEYRRAYWEETPDQDLIKRHEQQVFPLMKKRYLFAGASNFRLFPMSNSNGDKIDSVFAYTNRSDSERSLILVNNSYTAQAGWVNRATPVNLEPAATSAKLENSNLITALSFDVDDNNYLIFQEQISGLWYIRNIGELRQKGLYLELPGYASQIYLNFQAVNNTESNPWKSVHQQLGGRGVTDFTPILRNAEYEPIHKLLVNFLQLFTQSEQLPEMKPLFVKFAPLFDSMLGRHNIALLVEELQEHADKFRASLEVIYRHFELVEVKQSQDEILVYVILALGRQWSLASPNHKNSIVKGFWFQTSLKTLISTDADGNLPELIAVLEIAERNRDKLNSDVKGFFELLCSQEETIEYLLLNEVDDIQWFNKERMEKFLEYFKSIFDVELTKAAINSVQAALKNSEYQLLKFIKSL